MKEKESAGNSDEAREIEQFTSKDGLNRGFTVFVPNLDEVTQTMDCFRSNFGGISLPCKNGTGILAGSWQDPAKIPAGIPPRFWPPGFLPGFLAGCGVPGGQNLGRIPAGILPGFLAGDGIPGGQNLGGIPAGVLPGFLVGDGILSGQNLGRIPAGVLPGFLAGNRISRRECCRDLRRETKFLAVKIFPAAKNSGGPVWNLARIRDENVININQTTRR